MSHNLAESKLPSTFTLKKHFDVTSIALSYSYNEFYFFPAFFLLMQQGSKVLQQCSIILVLRVPSISVE